MDQGDRDLVLVSDNLEDMDRELLIIYSTSFLKFLYLKIKLCSR